MADREEIPAVWGEDGDHSINHSGLMSTEKYLPSLFNYYFYLEKGNLFRYYWRWKEHEMELEMKHTCITCNRKNIKAVIMVIKIALHAQK